MLFTGFLSDHVLMARRQENSRNKSFQNWAVVIYSRNIDTVTLKIIYFHDLNKYFLDQSILNKNNLILRTEALARWAHGQQDYDSANKIVHTRVLISLSHAFPTSQ